MVVLRIVVLVEIILAEVCSLLTSFFAEISAIECVVFTLVLVVSTFGSTVVSTSVV